MKLKKVKLWEGLYKNDGQIVGWSSPDGVVQFPKDYTAREADAFRAGWHACQERLRVEGSDTK